MPGLSIINLQYTSIASAVGFLIDAEALFWAFYLDSYSVDYERFSNYNNFITNLKEKGNNLCIFESTVFETLRLIEEKEISRVKKEDGLKRKSDLYKNREDVSRALGDFLNNLQYLCPVIDNAYIMDIPWKEFQDNYNKYDCDSYTLIHIKYCLKNGYALIADSIHFKAACALGIDVYTANPGMLEGI